MSSYLYKGVNLSDIYYSNSTDGSFYGYYGIPVGTDTSYNLLMPNTFGYISPSGEDLSTLVTANSSIFNDSSNVSIPSGCTSINVICVGGGGGGGGAGGKAEAKKFNGNWSSEANGGTGGSGGWVKSYETINQSVENVNDIYITVGTGGDGGTAGKNAQANYNFGSDKSVVAGKGNDGKVGNESSVVAISNPNTPIISAVGGDIGIGGSGAGAKSSSNGTTNTKSGDDAIPASPTISQYTPNKQYPRLYNNNSIEGGSGGSGGGNGDGTSGTPGVVQIIWLYD